MPYSRSHILIRIFQLLLSTALVITAALLLTYRSRSFTNFSNEPLASCISGAVAFIYASWALMNHRRQPDSAKWIYLHGFWCLLVCGLLLASSSLAFVLSQNGVPCWRIQESRELLNFSSNKDSEFDPTDGMTHLKARGLPTYQDGVQYAPGEYCKNDYYLLGLASAILGAVAAGMWVLDFCLIFGFCGTSGQYGSFRRNEDHRVAGTNINMSGSMAYHNQLYRQRRGQVGAEDYMADDEDYYPAGGYPPPSSSYRNPDNNNEDDTIYNEHDQYYYDMLDQRKRELQWRENRTFDDPKGHVQGPIPLSMQQSYYPTAYPDNVVVVREGLASSEGVMSPPVRMVIRDDFVPGMTTALSPPPRPSKTTVVHRPVQLPDSPTLPGQEDLEQAQQQEGGGEQEEGQGQQLPQLLRLPDPVQHTNSFLSTQSTSTTTTASTATTTTATTTQQLASPLVAPRTPRQKTPKQTPTRLQHKSSLPALELPPQHHLLFPSATTPPEDSTSTTSSRYIVYPPGPACYVFDPSQQEYLPSFVNMAARIEQKQHLKHSYSLSSSLQSSATGTGASTPTLPPTTATTVGGGTGAEDRRVIVTGLGMEVITRSSSEIEAERAAAAAASTTSTSAKSPYTSAAALLGSQESFHTLDLASGSGSGASTSPGLATPSAIASRLQRIAMPSGTSSGSYFPQQQPGVGSPTGSLKSFTSHKSSDSHHCNQNHNQYTHNSPHSYLQRMHSHPHLHSPLSTEISNNLADENENGNENEEISQQPSQQEQRQQQYQQVVKKPSMLKRNISKLTIVTPQSPPLHNNQPLSSGSSSDIQSLQHIYTPSPPRSPYIGDF